MSQKKAPRTFLQGAIEGMSKEEFDELVRIVQLSYWRYQEAVIIDGTNDAGFSKNDGGQGNAYRHALWQALLTDAFGEDHAKRIGDAHENRVPDDMNVRLFQGLEDADAMADMLNNIIGRRIGSDNKGAFNKKMAEHVLEEYRKHGLWSVDKTRNGYSLQKKNLSVEQYNQALQVIQNKGNNGLNIE